MLPEGVVAGNLLLKLAGGLVRTVGERLVRFAAGAGRGIDLLKVGDGERRFGGIFTGKRIVKIGEVRLAVAQTLDDKTHLKAPVTEMDVADHGVTEEAVDTLDGLADDGAAQVADMQRLCHVRSAVVKDNGARCALGGDAEMLRRGHLREIVGQICVRDAQVQKAGLHGIDLGKQGAAGEICRDIFGDLDGRLVIRLGGGHGAVALILTQVGAVRERDLSVGRVIAGGGKCAGDLARNQVKQ